MENKIVCFIDILAFKRLVEKSNSDKVIEEKIIDILKTIKWDLDIDKCRTKEYLKKYGIDHNIKGRKTFQFSDSIIITMSLTEPGSLFYLLNELFLMQIKLISFGIFIRGAITINNVFDDEFIFGIGVNEAYHLESNKAIYPRIIIEKEVVDKYIEIGNLYNSPTSEREYIEDFLIEDDKYFYINYFSPSPSIFDMKEYGAINYIDQLERSIEALKEDAEGKDSKKIDWLEKQIEYYSRPLLKEIQKIVEDGDM